MNGRIFTGVAKLAPGVVLTASLLFAQSPDWFLQGTAPDPGGRLAVGPGGRVIQAPLGNRGGLLAACAEDTAKFCNGQVGFGIRACLSQYVEKLSGSCKTAVAALSSCSWSRVSVIAVTEVGTASRRCSARETSCGANAHHALPGWRGAPGVTRFETKVSGSPSTPLATIVRARRMAGW